MKKILLATLASITLLSASSMKEIIAELKPIIGMQVDKMTSVRNIYSDPDFDKVLVFSYTSDLSSAGLTVENYPQVAKAMGKINKNQWCNSKSFDFVKDIGASLKLKYFDLNDILIAEELYSEKITNCNK
ncbi:hypothetical protein HOK00_03365 [bacterium]|jgi:hypothetical protein|nr:hypothetical protein [bacterium]